MPREEEDEEGNNGDDRSGVGGDRGSGDGNGGTSFVSAWAESVRASAVGYQSDSKASSSPLACLFRGEGLKASVEFVDSGGVTM